MAPTIPQATTAVARPTGAAKGEVATTTAAITPKAWRDFCLTTSFLARSRGTDSPIARTIYLFFRIGRILRVRCRSRWLLAGAGLVYALVCAHPGAGLVGTSPAFGKD